MFSGAGKGGRGGAAAPPNILQSGFLDSSKSDVVGGGGVRCVNIWLSSVRLRVMANA